MKRNLFFALTALFMLGCGSHQEESEQQVPDKKVIVVESKECDIPLRTPAQLRGKQDIAIIPQVSATIEQVLVQEGEKVTKGQRLFVLNQTTYQAAVENAQAAVNHAEAAVRTAQLEVNAQKILLDKGIISLTAYQLKENDFHMAQANLSEAQAALKNARHDLSYTIICAPHTGVVGTINYRQGALVSPQIEKPITVVSDNSTIYAYCSIAEINYMYLINRFGSADSAIANLPDAKLLLSGNSYYDKIGRLETMSGMIDPTTGAISLRFAFPNPDAKLVAGGSGQVELNYKENGIVIPRSATYDVQNKTFCYIAQPKDSSYIAHSQQIEVYRLNEKEFIVYDGLNDGDMVITEGVKKLTNGEPIHPVK